MRRILSLAVTLLALPMALPVAAQEVTEDGTAAGIKVETVLTGLLNPCGVAIRPGTEGDATEIFVADSGNLRVIKIKAGEPDKAIDVITEFPKDTYGKGPIYDIGPLGLVFLNQSTLVVGGGGLVDGKELLRAYKVPEDASPIKADQMDHSVGPIEPGDTSKQGEGNFYALAMNPQTSDAVYVSANGDDTKGWVLRSKVSGGKLEGLEGFLATKEKTNVDAPVGITMSPSNYLVVGQMGEITVPNDSLLTFYAPDSGDMVLNLETGLFDIAALAYSSKPIPKEEGDQAEDIHRLYALDFAWMETGEGGLFRLEATEEEEGAAGCYARKFVSLDKPAAMAFAPDGTLYVAIFGTKEEGSDAPPGKLLKITSENPEQFP